MGEKETKSIRKGKIGVENGQDERKGKQRDLEIRKKLEGGQRETFALHPIGNVTYNKVRPRDTVRNVGKIDKHKEKRE
ncbi:hypothetical protein K0M31_001830 [Melipona bicolor]|uniref:Uncharacterized protein n=1 Tax=Melipona bicolor TaxID=60889 RepID=A0AA40GGF4_9HYME|nr:hypothetical protein K0M31_001830 [Melipona bicolor]